MSDLVAERFLRQFQASVRDTATELARLFPNEPRAALHAEALLLLSRLLFLAFIEERGWLAGDRRFLRTRLNEDLAAGREYFASTLRPLFFGCLNVMEEERGDARRLGPIPYLNGGLFQPSPFEKRHPDLHVPNNLLRHIVLDAFGAFEFRMDPETNGSAIDPEMLGRVFESLMDHNDRRQSGSFYTPRPIAHALAGHAVAAWLDANRDHDALARITVLDPACGSGALLLAALNVIVRRQKLLGEAPDVRKIVAGSLYGVDRNPDAVRLCELRLWLAIAAAHREGDPIEPLPNLDRNILPGDSLLGATDFLGDASTEVYRGLVDPLRQQRALLERYRFAGSSERSALSRALRDNDVRFASALLRQGIAEGEAALRDAADIRRARELHEDLEAERARLTRVEDGALDFFSYSVHFAPIMAVGGFDLVLGNPPWVRSAAIEERVRRVLRARYRLFRGDAGEALAQPDLAIAFFERAMALTAPRGVLALLVPSKIATAGYAAPLRRALHGRVLSVIDWSADARFDATVDPLGVVLRPHATSPAIRLMQGGSATDVPALDLRAAPGSEWAVVPPLLLPLLRRLYAEYPPLATALGRRPFMGVKTGDNARFFLDAGDVVGHTLVTSAGVQVPLASACLCVRGRNVRRWKVEGSVWMIRVTAEDRRTPPPWLEELAEARGVRPADFRFAFAAADEEASRVAWKDLSRGLAAVVLPHTVKVGANRVPVVPNQTLYAVAAGSDEEAHLIAAVLNSTVAGALLVAVAERAKDRYYRYFGRTVTMLPWPDVAAVQAKLAELSRRAHEGADVAGELDCLVAQAYGVSDVELSALGRFLEGRLR
jgi:methylase of polypeptide subunit release factors